MGLAKTVAPSFKNLADRLSRPATLFSSKFWGSFNIVSSDTTLNLNLDLRYFRNFSKYCRTEFKPNIKEGGGKLASKLSASGPIILLKMLSSKLVMSSFVLRQVFVKGLLIEAIRRVFRKFFNSFGLQMFSVNFVLRKSIFLFN